MASERRIHIRRRNGVLEPIQFEKVHKRLQLLGSPSLPGSRENTRFRQLDCDFSVVTQQVIARIYDGISTSELDSVAADVAISLLSQHPDYGWLSSRILITRLHKETKKSVLSTFRNLYVNANLADDVFEVVKKNAKQLEAMIDYSNDFSYDYFAVKTLFSIYLTKCDGKIVERPQHMLLRVALGLWKDNLTLVEETYRALSDKLYTHASPTIFNSGLKLPQLASCFKAGTIVTTVNRGPVRVEEVNLGDRVVTHTGDIKPVTQLHTNPRGDRNMFDLSVYKSPVVTVTGNHRLWGMRQHDNTPGWLPVDELEVGDFVGIPNGGHRRTDVERLDVMDFLSEELKFDQGPRGKVIIVPGEEHVEIVTSFPRETFGRVTKMSRPGARTPRFWELHDDTCCLLGIFCGDGHIISRSGNPAGIGFTIHKVNGELIRYVKKVGEGTFGVKARVSGPQRDTIQIYFYSAVIGRTFKALCGKGFAGKHVHPSLFQWSRGQVEAFIAGVVTTDGWFDRKGNVRIKMANIGFMRSLYYLGRNVGIDISYGGKEDRAPNSTRPFVTMNIPRFPKLFDHLFKTYADDRIDLWRNKTSRFKTFCSCQVEGRMYLRVRDKRPVPEHELPDTVYTLGVADDHSYAVEGLVAENCFLLGVEDSVEGLWRSFRQSAMISKYAGGVGVSWHDVRSTGAKINGTNGVSDGIVPFLKVLNATMRAVNQGGRRAGSAAVYLEPSHPDIVAFLRAKKNHGAEEERARDLFYALWIPDLFFKRVEAGAPWSLFDPAACPGLSDVYGEEYEILYEKYEQEEKYASQMSAVTLFEMIIVSMIETGTPYLLAKDACNQKSNQKNVGTIKCSNLCSEIVEYSSPDEIAVCLTGDTEVMTEDGVRFLREIGRKGGRTSGVNTNHRELPRTAPKVVSALSDDDVTQHVPKRTQKYIGGVRLLDNGLKPVIRVDLRGTRPIKATNDHKFLVIVHNEGYTWKKTDRLKAGDCIVMPKLDPLPAFNKGYHNLNPDYANMGWCAAGGGPAPKPPVNYDSSPAAVDRESPANGDPSANYDRTSPSLPDDIRTAGPSNIASFLSGYFSATGQVHVIEKELIIAVSSPLNMSILYDIQSLLRCFGVNSRCSESNTQRVLLILGRENLLRFKKFIGFGLCEMKEVELNSFAPAFLRDSFGDHEWATVISTKRAGIERVYDLHVPISHNFIANGLVTHNCTLASISLPAFVRTESTPSVKRETRHEPTDEPRTDEPRTDEPRTDDPTSETPARANEPKIWFDHDALHETVKLVTRNLNRVIDVGYLPLHEAKYSNSRHRPIGIGTQGLADTFAMMRLPFDSSKAMELNRSIAETIYHASVTQSLELAKTEGAYETFRGSPASQGSLQFDLWDVSPPSDRYDWASLKADIQRVGMRNSLLVAHMPTASTSQLLNNTETNEPFTSMIFKRQTLSGEHVVINRHLVSDLMKLGIWSSDIKDSIVANDGSVQHLRGVVPQKILDLYRTVWEIKQRTLIDMAAARGPYVCQSQSMNLFFSSPNTVKFSSAILHAWKSGLKTLVYYSRTKAASRAVPVTLRKNVAKAQECLSCSA